MTDKHPTRLHDTLVSPLELADQPRWLQLASPTHRRRLQEHQALGRQARREATQAFAAVQSLYAFNRTELMAIDSATVTPTTLLDIQQATALTARYKAHLKTLLNDPALRAAKQDAYLATLREEWTIADIKGDLDKQGRQILEWFVSGFASGSVEFPTPGIYIDGKLAICACLQLPKGLDLPDILLFGAVEDDTPCVMFMPGHPQHPVKQYNSREQCFASLRRELLAPDFQRFFSRFVPLKRQQQALAIWADRDALLTLPMQAVPPDQGLRAFVPAKMTARLLSDASFLIPLDADQAKRLQVVCSRYGRAIEEHVMLGAGAGISPGEEDEGRAPSDWIAPLRAIRAGTANTCQRWLPDLSTYGLGATAPPSAPVDNQGLQNLGEDKAIVINQTLYRVEKAADDTWCIQHPSATDCYRPRLQHNGHGAWHHSLERPQTWDRLTLLRRLGPVSAGFEAARLLQIARVSGVSNAQLREVYQLDKPVPILLLDALQRARIHDEAAAVLVLIKNGQRVAGIDQSELLTAFYRAVATYNGEPEPPRRGRRSNDDEDAGQACDEQCTPPPSEVYWLWVSRLSRAIIAHRYELAQSDTDEVVRELQRRYPYMPLSVAQRGLDANRANVRAALLTETGVLPLQFAERAHTLEQDARLSRALEGFTELSSINTDTFVLAVRLLEYMDGWLPGTALLLRQGDRFGTPLAALGETDVETTCVFLDDEEGWSTSMADQLPLVQDMTLYGFYRALLYAMSETQRVQLGLGLNEPERLHQQLQALALARPARARLLLGLPLQRRWLAPPPMAAVRRNPGLPDAELLAYEPVQVRLERLLTQHSSDLPRRTAERYITGLLHRNEPIGPRVQALEQERVELDTVLDNWIAQSPHDGIRQWRTNASYQLRYAWESHLVAREVNLIFESSEMGEVPLLPVSLPAVVSLTLRDLTRIDNLANFLDRMPHLTRLEIIDLPLGVLPDGVAQMRHLRLLELTGTALAPADLAPLGRLTSLQNLIFTLGNNALHWSSHDMRALTNPGLQTLSIQHSRAFFGPGVFAVLARLPELHSLGLSGNQISLAGEERAELATLRSLRSLDLSNNPLQRMPDLRQMQHLEELDLSRLDGPITEWPEGLETLPRIVSADLRALSILNVPPGAGSTRGLRMSSAFLPAPMRERFEEEMRMVGNDGNDSVHSGDDESGSQGSDTSSDSFEYSAAPARNANTLQEATRLFVGMTDSDRQQAAQLLIPGDSNASEFFALLLRIDVSAQARRPAANLRSRIQAMIRGAFNTDLREALQEQARQAVSCVDRDALVFAQMENLLHADAALAKASDAAAASDLIAMATSHWRVHRLKEHVTANIRGWHRAGHQIDYSEIELYFRIALAQRLGLRDQPQTQIYTSYTTWVTPAMIDTAYDAVLAPQADLLPSYLNEQPYWQRFLDCAYAPQIEAINAWRDRIGQYLDAAAATEDLPPPLGPQEAERLQNILIDIALLPERQPLPATLQLNSEQYVAAYTALTRQVEQARKALTESILAPKPGPSHRP